MKIVNFSDTHNLHDKVKLPKCDIAIFAGDFSGRGNRLETFYFFRWFSSQNQCKYKIITIGNHDICFDAKHNSETHAYNWLPDILKKFNNIIVLNNSSIVIEGINIFGSPATPWYHGDRWGFNYEYDDIINIWQKIPNNTDILITHGPAFGILDKINGKNAGCINLLNRIKEIKPKYHIFGHIHEGYGIIKQEGTTFINCSVVDNEYYPTNKPIKINYKYDLPWYYFVFRYLTLSKH